VRFLADLHIHSHYSISTSRQLTPEHLDAWARRKGISVIGTGDFTHPGWLAELAECLEPAEEGLYRLKAERVAATAGREPGGLPPGGEKAPVRFLLSAEISNIYRQGGRTRKVHNLIFAPDFETARRLQRRLSSLANLASDGRPILGLSSRDLLEMALECSERILFVPAHIWTPWFSALGDKSGFESIEECYGDLAREIHAVESGLSSDPPMNWLCSFLDRYTLISNSDAHSPERLGREGNIFDCELSYPGIAGALHRGHGGFLGTVEFFPEEGKYHHDGHRKCGVRWDPAETLRRGTICPVCGKPVTVGVLNRVARLADREALPDPRGRPIFHSLIPLKEILGEINGVGAQSREVDRQYEAILHSAGPELRLLIDVPVSELERAGGELLAEAVRRMRTGEVITEAGFDGEYGHVRLFAQGENRLPARGVQELGLTPPPPAPRRIRRALLGFDFAAYRAAATPSPLKGQTVSREAPVQLSLPQSETALLDGLNAEQRQAATYVGGPALVLAGPGTGKTRTLTARIAFLLQERGVPPESPLALTFTNKAAREMRERLEAGLGPQVRAVRACTFHTFGLALLRSLQTLEKDPVVLDEQERLALLASLPGGSPRQAVRLAARISRLKQEMVSPEAILDTDPDRSLKESYAAYESALQTDGLVDLDDLVRLPVLRLQGDAQLLQRWRERIGPLLVDEYQDVNLAQYSLLRLLAPGGEADLWVVGDPNQAIYGFRGADVRFIEGFCEDYPRAAVFRLPRSYRCAETILQASNQVLRSGAAPLEGPDPGVPLQLVSETSDRSEAEFVARTIEDMVGGLRFFSLDSAVSAGQIHEGIGGLADFAVLCRTGRQMPLLERAFHDHAIPYRKADELPFFKREPSRSLLGALRALDRGAARPLDRSKALVPEAAWQPLRAAVPPLRELTVREGLQRILDAAGPAISGKDREGLLPLLELATEFGRDLQGFLELAALGAAADGLPAAGRREPAEARRRDERVALLTIHTAKGLEWPCVFIVGCEDGLLPYTLFGDEDSNARRDEAEERRLLYVGMTRAKRFLYLTRALRRNLFGRELHLPPSPFLAAIEERLIESLAPGAPRRPERGRGRQLELFPSQD
jgi:DNA helicase-2/ATP-dependent DNA helicase PcrA